LKQAKPGLVLALTLQYIDIHHGCNTLVGNVLIERSGLMNQLPIYHCKEQSMNHFPTAKDEIWDKIPQIILLDVVTGGTSRLSTTVQAFWSKSSESMYFRFVCDDDYMVSTMTNHDDPIYEEDVVEVFISETGSLQDYKEFEVSPTNVKFDAQIRNTPPERLKVSTEWDAAGWKTEVYWNEDRTQYVSVWELPFANFEGGCPAQGDEWRMNCYRIDRGRSKESDQYTAWSPTGIANFHVPANFGYLRFE
jgi:hypothetical protein